MSSAQLNSKHLRGQRVLNVLGGPREGKLNNCSLETQRISTDERKIKQANHFLAEPLCPCRKSLFSHPLVCILGEINQLCGRRWLLMPGRHLSLGCLATFSLLMVFSTQMTAECGQKKEIPARACVQRGLGCEEPARRSVAVAHSTPQPSFNVEGAGTSPSSPTHPPLLLQWGT